MEAFFGNISDAEKERMRGLMGELGVNESMLDDMNSRMAQANIGSDRPVGMRKCANQGCNETGTLKCAKCKQARYCSKECQVSDWKPRHKAVCGKDKDVAVSVDPLSMLASIDAGRTGGWYAGDLTRKRIYKRLCMSFQLRVEDEYCYGGNLVGTYGAQADGAPKSQTSDQFRRYVNVFRTKGMLPPDWSEKDDRALLKMAEGHIHYALEKSDVIEKFGYSSGEHQVLRSMAENALGPIGSWLPYESDNDEGGESD